MHPIKDVRRDIYLSTIDIVRNERKDRFYIFEVEGNYREANELIRALVSQ